MEVKERRPYRSLTSRRDTERRYTSSSADSEDGKLNPKSYSSSETLKAFDQDSRLAYGSRVKDVVHHEADEFSRPGKENKISNQDGMDQTIGSLSGTNQIFEMIVYCELFFELACSMHIYLGTTTNCA